MLQEQNNANAQKMQQREVKDFWSDMSDDFIITVVEKKILKSKWEEIQKSYAESIADAAAQGTLAIERTGLLRETNLKKGTFTNGYR